MATPEKDIEEGNNTIDDKLKSTILVVDDDPAIRLLLRDELEEEGYKIITVGDGDLAKGLIGIIEPNLVTLDLHIPGLHGTKVLGEFKKYNSKLPVIIYSAYNYFDKPEVFAADAYLFKEADLTPLKEEINKLLSGNNSDNLYK